MVRGVTATRVAVACAAAAGCCLAVSSLAGGGGSIPAVLAAARSSPGVGWAGSHTGWSAGDGGSPMDGGDKARGERRGLDGEWMGLPANKAYYADGWTAGTPEKYWYSTCSRENGCSGENLPQNVAERTSDYDDGWDISAEPIPSNLDWMRYGHAPYTGSVLNKHGEAWESYPYGDANAYLDSYTGPFNQADLDAEIRNGAGRNGGWANRERERDGGWWDGEEEKRELDEQGKGADRYSYFWRTDNVMGYPEEDLPIRSTYEYDLTTGGKPYEHFWGGEDAIAKDVRAVSDFFKDDRDTPEEGSNDKFAMKKWYGDESSEEPDDESYKSLWRKDLQLGGDLAGVVDGDIYGDGGLVYTYRRSYDDENAYDLKPWQEHSELNGVKDGSKVKLPYA
jgi:hypothetical protein